MNDFWNTVRRYIENYLRANIADPRIGTVIAVDTGQITGVLAAQCEILPEKMKTGWLPIQSPWAGNGWGIVAVPPIGQQVYISFQENNRSVGTITGFHYDINNPPPQGAESGELWLVHKEGGFLKLSNTGDVTLAGKPQNDGDPPASVKLGADGVTTISGPGSSPATIILDADGKISISAAAGQTVDIASDTQINIGDSGGSLQTLILSTCAAAINNHTHRFTAGAGSVPGFTAAPLQAPLISGSDITTKAKAD